MITPTYDWQVNTDEPSEDFVKLVKTKIDALSARLLWKRQVRTEEALMTF